MRTHAWEKKEWITSAELADYLGKTVNAARHWAWRMGIKRSPADSHLISKRDVDATLRNGKQKH